MRDPARPRDFLDKRVDDVEGLELLVLPEHVASRKCEDGLGLRDAPTRSRLGTRLLVLVVRADDPVLELLHIPSLGGGKRLIVKEETEVVRRELGLKHDELVLGREHGAVPDELDLPAVERDRLVVQRRTEGDRAESVEVGLLAHPRDRGDEDTGVPDHRRPLLCGDPADHRGLRACELTGDWTELDEVRVIGLQARDDIGALVDDTLHPAGVEVREVLLPRLLELVRVEGKVAVVLLPDPRTSRDVCKVLGRKMVVDGSQGLGVLEAVLRALPVLLDVVVSLKHRCTSSRSPALPPRSSRPPRTLRSTWPPRRPSYNGRHLSRRHTAKPAGPRRTPA